MSRGSGRWSVIATVADNSYRRQRDNKLFCQEMSTATKETGVWQLTIASLGILLIFYPMTWAAIGPNSNGGILGFGLLVLASTFGWIAFVRQRSNLLLRWFLNLPIAAVVTWTALSDALAQCRSGWWLGF